MGSRPRWIQVTWEELEPILRELLGLEMTEWDYGYGGELVRVARRPEDVAKDILDALEAKGFHLMKLHP